MVLNNNLRRNSRDRRMNHHYDHRLEVPITVPVLATGFDNIIPPHYSLLGYKHI